MTPATCATPIARFDQVKGVSDAERDAAWRRIRAAARKYGVEVSARGWRQLMKGGRNLAVEIALSSRAE